MDNRLLQRLAIFGIMGGVLMLFGDLCFYMTAISGEDFINTPVMASMSTQRLIIGGLAGPLAGLLYALGAMMFYVAFRDFDKRLARITAGLFVIMFVVGGAYHSIYTTYGFVPANDLSEISDKISALINALQRVSFVIGLTASFLFIYMTLRYKTVFPKWIIIFTPTFWTLLNGPIAPFIPYPAGSVIIGGWVNLCFIVFFTLCAVLFSNAHHLPKN